MMWQITPTPSICYCRKLADNRHLVIRNQNHPQYFEFLRVNIIIILMSSVITIDLNSHLDLENVFRALLSRWFNAVLSSLQYFCNLKAMQSFRHSQTSNNAFLFI